MKNHINIKIDYDVIIVGAGPAGLSSAIYTSRAGLKTLVLEKSIPGGKVSLTSDVENYPGYVNISGPDLANKFLEHAQATGAIIQYNGLEDYEIKHKYFYAYLENGEKLICRALIFATGTRENHLNVSGEEEYYGKGVSYCGTCDGPTPRFKDKPMVVVGGGYSAIEEALFLTRFASKIHLVHRSQKFRVDSKMLSKAKENPKIIFHYDSIVEEIIGENNEVRNVKIKNLITDKKNIIECVAVFPFIGQNPITNYVKNDEILNEENYIKAKTDMSTEIPGLFTAGDVRDTPFRQIVTAASDGALAGQSAVKYIENLD